MSFDINLMLFCFDCVWRLLSSYFELMFIPCRVILQELSAWGLLILKGGRGTKCAALGQICRNRCPGGVPVVSRCGVPVVGGVPVWCTGVVSESRRGVLPVWCPGGVGVVPVWWPDGVPVVSQWYPGGGVPVVVSRW